jgi:hypothetical protein
MREVIESSVLKASNFSASNSEYVKTVIQAWVLNMNEFIRAYNIHL